MANSTKIITNALARLGVVGAERIPATADLELGLSELKDMLRQFIYSGALGKRNVVIPTGDYVAGENEHVILRYVEADSLVIPDLVADGQVTSDYGMLAATGERVPRDGAYVIVSDEFTNQTVEYIYDGPTAKWLEISNLTLTSEVPFSTKDQVGLAASLACRIADQFGADIPQATAELQRRFKWNLTNDLTESYVSDTSKGTYY